MSLAAFVLTIGAGRCAVAAPGASEPPLARTAPNALYVELLGSGPFYTLNYDRAILPHATVRAGFTVMPLSDVTIVSTTLGGSALLGGGDHCAELGVTISLGVGDRTRAPQTSQPLVAPGAVIGYRYQPRDGGIVLRAAFTPLVVLLAPNLGGQADLDYDAAGKPVLRETSPYVAPLGGVSLGYAF